MMKKILLPLLFMAGLGTNAQVIQNISYSPAFPGPLDPVSVYIDLMFTSGTCEMQFENHMIGTDSIRINIFHCPGALTVICPTTDTINLGTLPAGNYYTEVILHTGDWSAPDPCSNQSPADSGNLQITVLTGTGILHTPGVESTFNYIASAHEFDLMLSSGKNFILHIFDLGAKEIFTRRIEGSGHIKAPVLSPGLYFYSVESEKGMELRGKFRVE